MTQTQNPPSSGNGHGGLGGPGAPGGAGGPTRWNEQRMQVGANQREAALEDMRQKMHQFVIHELGPLLTDQRIISGIGNAYSDEILHTAKLSPFATAKSLDAEAVERLWVAMHAVLSDAIVRLEGQEVATMKSEKRSGLRVHARTGMPCPVCGDTVREVSFADRSFQYCPTCQTGGKVLADRRMSRLLK